MTVLNITTRSPNNERLVWLMFVLEAGETAVADQVLHSFDLLP